MEGSDGAQECRRELEGVKGAKGTAETVPHLQLLSMMEVNSNDRDDLPEASGDVGEEPPARQMEVGGGGMNDDSLDLYAEVHRGHGVPGLVVGDALDR